MAHLEKHMRNSTSYGFTTRTFRRTSRKLFDIWGSNMANIESSVRQIYIPDGFSHDLQERLAYWIKTGDLSIFRAEELERIQVFVQPDQSGAEALIVAYLCRPGRYRQIFENKINPHAYLGMHLFKDVWPKKMKERGGMTEDLDIDKLCSLPIPELKHNAYWPDLVLLIKDSDNWGSGERYYYYAKQTGHCVDEKTEVLTLDGWRAVSEMKYRRKESIATFDFDGNISFEIPSAWNEFDYSGLMIHFEGDEVDQFVTDEHKMVYYNSSTRRYYNTPAYKLFYDSEPRIPTSGIYNGSMSVPSWEVKLLAAIQADAEMRSDSCVRFRLAKERKCKRLREILKEGNIKFEEKVGGITSTNMVIKEFWIYNIEHILYHFNGNKQWGPWLLKFSRGNLETLVEELSYWDGSYVSEHLHKREDYCSSIYENIEWIKTVCHLIKRQGTIGNPQNGNWKIGLNNRFCSRVKRKTKIENQQLKVYCPTVSTGMFLIRRNGKISITGNSANYGIEHYTFRMNVLEKSGGKVVIPEKEAIRYLNTYRGELYPEIPEWNEHIRQIVTADERVKYLYNLFGHPYTITNYNNLDADIKEYIAWIPQSTVGEITLVAFTNLYEYIRSNRKHWTILADTHDSYMSQGPLYDTPERIRKMREFIEIELESPFDGTKFRMRSDYGCGFNWNKYHKEKNPLGLQDLKWAA